MPNIPSAVKRVHRSEKARLKNQAVKSKISSTRRKLFEAFAGKDAEKSRLIFQQYCSILDKASKKGVIKKNTAIRRKRRAAAQIAALA